MGAFARIDPPSAAAKAAVDDMRVEWIGETADLAIPFLVSAREPPAPATRPSSAIACGRCGLRPRP